jgi:hypothetical protein
LIAALHRFRLRTARRASEGKHREEREGWEQGGMVTMKKKRRKTKRKEKDVDPEAVCIAVLQGS